MALLMLQSGGWDSGPILAALFFLITFLAGWAMGHTATRRAVQKDLNGFRAEIQSELARAAAAPLPPKAEVAKPAPAPAAVKQEEAPAAAAPEKQEITQETLLVLAAAVTAFLGKKVRVRSARLLTAPGPGTSPWAQQGRVFIQASHNLGALQRH